ncbi:MAG: DEAD/DEAH box helicase [Bifidobacterium tsurumiense]|uniref:DEAD/DEAH box helicase n=1 Tax=Bifidobacterium tsurumiense TaxID=356829 RepID=UPI002A81A277|nr:DEAD/DEAH box helicase [Bifidobacterium tsurumiense]MDY4678364.1 DEAD/DEAH box helicase [Bifidobacterium tsurumiense]
MYDGLEGFSEVTAQWFAHSFLHPTQVQRQAWPAIRRGDHVLAIAPTGSGKTLSAFLWAIDRLIGDQLKHREQRNATKRTSRRKGVKVLYISPLKALGVDVAKNLQIPLEGIAEVCKTRLGIVPDIRVAMRSGDSTAQERRSIVSRPPDILVTTPESLFLMLTSQARRILETVDTVIIDEVHAVAGSKRGAHLALSLERLETNAQHRIQRIGLSATVRPVEEAARWLGGDRKVQIINAGARLDMDIRVVEPLADMRDTANTTASSSIHSPAGSKSPVPRITGVTPAMQRLAERNQRYESSKSSDISASNAPASKQWQLPTQQHGSVASASVWPAIEHSVLEEILKHRTTLVFVNSRGLAERLTARLNDAYAEMHSAHEEAAQIDETADDIKHHSSLMGPTSMLVNTGHASPIAMVHHGSVSKERRADIEHRLKQGRLRCVVATSSLELGIDMGSIDLVIQVAPPLSVSSGLQRIGRADHTVGGKPKALMYPLTREQIITMTASVESMRAGELERMAVPNNPLDILAQQTVAAAALDSLNPDEWYATVLHSAPFAHLDRESFDSVLGMMTGTYNSEDFSVFRPPLDKDAETGNIIARPGAQRLAVTSGGTIPDRGMYTVLMPKSDSSSAPRRVGELDEEMVYESRVGDVITLGTSSWRIQEITRDRVLVVPAPGQRARLPFWHGEGNGRDADFASAEGRLLRDLSHGLVATNAVPEQSSVFQTVDGEPDDPSRPGADLVEEQGHLPISEPTFLDDIVSRLRSDGLDDNAIANLAQLLAEQRSATGIIPDDRRIVVERYKDEEDDWMVVVHSPYGRRVHEPWALALSSLLSQRFGVDGEINAADDGILIRLPDGVHPSVIVDILRCDSEDLRRIVQEHVGQTVLFAARFRECAARSLFLARTRPGKRVPLWQQRLRASQLLSVAKRQAHFPLLLETARECLQDVYDLPALIAIMDQLQEGTITISEVETTTPSPFAQRILFGFLGDVMYQGDMPQAERDAQLLAMDIHALERLIGQETMSKILDADVISNVEQELAGRQFWNELSNDDIQGRITRYAKTHGPFTADEVMEQLHLDAEQTVRILQSMRSSGEVLSGIFVEDELHAAGVEQWIHRDVLRLIRNRSLRKARQAIRPVSAQEYQRFLIDRQGVGPVGKEQYEGLDGLMRVIEQCEGLALPAQVWEQSVFPRRVRGYQPSMLDELLASGEVIWVGSSNHASIRYGETGNIAWYVSDSTLLGSAAPHNDVMPNQQHSETDFAKQSEPTQSIFDRDEPTEDATNNLYQNVAAHAVDTANESQLSSLIASGMDSQTIISAAIEEELQRGGAYRVSQLASCVRDKIQSEVQHVQQQAEAMVSVAWNEDDFAKALWALVWHGSVTNSSFMPIRALLKSTTAPRSSRMHSARSMRRRCAANRGSIPASLVGMWSIIGAQTQTKPSAEERIIALIEALLDRYGIIAQPLVELESIPGGLSGLYPVLSRMEERGVLLRGMFVEGLGAAQFAARETVDALRQSGGSTQFGAIMLDAMDPANTVGSLFPWPQLAGESAQPQRKAGNAVIVGQRCAIAYISGRGRHIAITQECDSDGHSAEVEAAMQQLAQCMRAQANTKAVVTDINGLSPIRGGVAVQALKQAGYVPTPQGLRLYI